MDLPLLLANDERLVIETDVDNDPWHAKFIKHYKSAESSIQVLY